MNDQKEIVLVTGATGFLASHIVKLLLQTGYKVRGTVRDLQRPSVQELKSIVTEKESALLELVEADLAKTELNEWLEIVKDCSYVIHTATVIPSSNSGLDDDQVVNITLTGTLNILNACAHVESKVKRLVYTSSVVTMCGDVVEKNRIYTEKDWADLVGQYSYTKSKILTEKSIWNIVRDRELSGTHCCEVAVINPGYLLVSSLLQIRILIQFIFYKKGPVLLNKLNESLMTIKKMMNRELPFYFLADFYIPCCDVRDAALAHMRAMLLPQAVSFRHIITSTYESTSLFEWSRLLRETFASRYSIAQHVLPHSLVRVYSLFDAEARQVIKSDRLNNN